MSYNSPSRRRASRLSTPVRLGVAAVAACFIAAPALSNPLNPTVVNGAATFNQVGNVLTVTNSNGAIINWDKFSIKAGETTRFQQPSASSSVLNRVLNDPTAIYGTLSSNGRVWLVNPAGIMVGAGGRVDVAGFVASTLNVTNADFLAGRNLFVNDGSARDVVNQGTITTPAGGSVYLIGSNVSNEGIIITPKGETILAAGATVSLIDSALPGVKVDITGAAGNSTNLGEITAEAGRIGIAGVIVRNSGVLNASSVVSEGGRVFLKASKDATVDGSGRIAANGTIGGEVRVDAGDIATIRGRIEAEGSGGGGGAIDVFGDKVALLGKAYLDASGAFGGGRLRIGGDYQGANRDVRNARFTYVGQDVTLETSATGVGAGGTAIVWADDTTRAYGKISARGGMAGGDGGLVEVSGKRQLDFLAQVRVGARGPGAPGTLLLDPETLWIANFGGALPQIGDPALPFAAISTGIATISPASLAAVGGNISLAAKELLIDDPITLTAAGAGLTASAGKLLVVTPGSTITTNNGAVSLTGGVVAAPTNQDTTDFPLVGPGSCASSSQCYARGSLLIMAPINSGGGAISLVAQNGNLYLKDAVSSAGGAISLNASATIYSGYYDQPVSGASLYRTGSLDGGTGSLNLSGAYLQLEGSLAATGGITMTASSSVYNYANTSFGAGNLSITAPSGITSYYLSGSGPVSASSASGSIYLSSGLGGLQVASASAGSSVQLYADGNLALGNISGNNVYLDSNSGAISGIDASSKVTGSYVSLTADGSTGSIGSTALPLAVDSSSLVVSVDSKVNIQIPAAPARTLSALNLTLDAGGLGSTSSIAGGPVLGNGMTLSSDGSLVTASVNPGVALGSFGLTVRNGGLTVPAISNVGSMTLRADDALSIAAATGSGSSAFLAQSYNATLSLGSIGSVGSISASAATGITLGSLTGTSANISTNSGGIVAAADNLGYEINVGAGSASLYAYNGSIGGANSFDLRSGSASLYTGGTGAIGSAARPVVLTSSSSVTIDTDGGFNVLGMDLGTSSLVAFSRLNLYMRAGGMGTASSIVSANFPIGDFAGNAFNPVSDGTTITLPDLTNHGFASGLSLYVNDPSFSGLGNMVLGQVQAATGSFYLSVPGSVSQLGGKHIAMGTRQVSIYANSAVSLGDVTAGVTNFNSYYDALSFGAVNATNLNAYGATNLTATSVVSTGNVYLSADGGNLAVGDVNTSSSYLSLTAGGALNAGNLTSGYQISANAGGALTLGNLTVPSYADLSGNSIQLGRATNAALGNLGGSLQIYSAQPFTDANVLDAVNGLRANSLTLGASSAGGAYAIDLATTPVSATNANLSGGDGNIRVNLTGTTGLTLSSGGSFDVATSAAALSNLAISGYAAGIGSSLLVSTHASPLQTFSFSGGAISDLVVANTASSSINLSLSVSGLAAGSNVALNNVATFGGSITVNSYDGGLTATNVNTLNAALAGGHIELYSAAGNLGANLVATSANRTLSLVTDGGNIAASDLTGGAVYLYASSGGITASNVLGAATTLEANNDITLANVSTTHASAAGSPLVVRSYSGSILNPAGSPLVVGTASTTIEAWSGSVGSAADPVAIQTTGNLSQLHVNALDHIAIDVQSGASAASVAHLDVSFNGVSASAPYLAINTANLPAGFLTRSLAGDVTVGGGATPGLTQLSVVNHGGPLTLVGSLLSPLQNVTLQASTDLAINGNIAATGSVVLRADNDLLIAASGSPRSVVGSAFNLQAGRDIQLLAGALAGESLVITATGSGNIAANGDILVNGATGGVAISSGGGSMTVSGRDFWVRSGSAGASVSSGSLTLYSYGGGTHGVKIEAEQANASLSSSSQSIYAYNGISVLGGSAANAAASLTATNSQYLYAFGPGSVTVAAGNFAGASALVSAGQHQYLQSYYDNFYRLDVIAGSATNAFARISAGLTQSVQVGNGGIHLSAGNTEGASAELTAVSLQQISGGSGGITLTGGSSANAANLTHARIRNSASSTQTVSTSGVINLIGGGANATTAITNLGNGNQSLSATTINLATTPASVGSGSSVAIEQLNAIGAQFVNASGALTLYNDDSPGDVHIIAAGRQEVEAASIDLRIGASNSSAAATASIESGGNQNVWARSLLKLVAHGMGTASIETAGLEQSVGALTFSLTGAAPMGDIVLGNSAALGTSKILSSAASGFQEVIAGSQLSLLGGAAGSLSKIDAAGTQAISILGGGLTMNGGSGVAAVDPLTQSIFTNGNVSLTNATISGTTGALVATQGDIGLSGSSLAATNLTVIGAANFNADAGSSVGTAGAIYYGGTYVNSGTVAPGMTVGRIPVYGVAAGGQSTPSEPVSVQLMNDINNAVEKGSTSAAPTESDAPRPFTKPDSEKTASCDKDSFGCDEDRKDKNKPDQSKDDKKDEKPGQKKVASCSM